MSNGEVKELWGRSFHLVRRGVDEARGGGGGKESGPGTEEPGGGGGQGQPGKGPAGAPRGQGQPGEGPAGAPGGSSQSCFHSKRSRVRCPPGRGQGPPGN